MKLKLSEAVSAFTELPLSEAKFAVDVEDIGVVIVDGSSEGEVKAKVARKLKGGKDAIKGVRKITKDKAGKASKAIGENPEADADGMGEPDGHERGKATKGERWLKANPKNQW